jgi:hypothetical protein
MTDPRLENARKLLREDEQKKANNGRSGGDNALYPFYNIPENQMATIRLLPDHDTTNPWFWVVREVIYLPFKGVVGGDNPRDEPVQVTVPCVAMFGDTCPIMTITRPWWKIPAKEALARQYYKKRSYLMQGFVVNSPFEEKEPPENPIRRFNLGISLLEKIKAGLVDPEMEHWPTDYLNGCDFRIRKTKKDNRNNYDTSTWARRPRALTEAERLHIEKHKLFDLKQFLGPRPDADGIALIKALFHASLANEPFDVESFGTTYRPYGQSSDSETDLPSPRSGGLGDGDLATEVSRVETAAASNEAVGASDLLAKLRQKTANRAA